MDTNEIKSVKKIAAKLVAVMEECSHVLKRGTNDFHHYSYATSADVLEKVNAALVKQKICSVVNAELISLDNVVNSKGNTEHLASVQVNIVLIDAESGESLSISGIGNGQDAGDKAVMKAETAAIKYAYMMSLVISTGDDPEADTRTDEGTAGGNVIAPAPVRRTAGTRKTAGLCADCGAGISEKVMTFSEQRFGRALCMDCQKNYAVA